MEIQTIKQQSDILEIARDLGIHIDTRTKRAICPFHNDTTPSLQFSKSKQICTCFSSNCNLGTVDVIGLVEKSHNCSTHEALMYLKEKTGINNVQTHYSASPNKISTMTKIATLTKAFTHFTQSFNNSSPAKEYVISRNLNPQQIEVGYQNGTFYKGISKELLESYKQVGLLKKVNSGLSPFGLGSLVFPLKNKKGEIVSLYFRAVEPRPQKFAGRKYVPHLYLQDRAGLYPGYPSSEAGQLILTESIIDTLSLQSAIQESGSPSEVEVLSLYGTNGLTTDHLEAIKEWVNTGETQRQAQGPKEIIFFLDGDPSGREAIKKHSELLQSLYSQVNYSFVNTPEGEDISSLKENYTENFAEVIQELLTNRNPLETRKASQSENHEIKEHTQTEEPNQNNLKLIIKNSKLNISNPNKIYYTSETAIYYIKGGLPRALDTMRVTLEIECSQTLGSGNVRRKSRTKLDLYEDKQVEKVAREAAEKLGLRADQLELDLNYVTDLLDEYRDQAMPGDKLEKNKPVQISEADKQKCYAFLKQKNLVHKFNELIEKSGITGEENNRIFLFVIATAYKMPDTLHALIQGSSGSGKTYLSKQITDLIPPEDIIRLTRVTESSFYNFGEYELQNKLVVLEDVDGLKEEAEYAFRELQSNGEIISGLSVKNENTGNFNTIQKKVRGPIGSIATTTKGEIYEDNMSRIFLLAVDESKEQTTRIITYLNRKASGSLQKEKEKAGKAFAQNCLRLLKPYEVINPFADKIYLPQEAHKIRRLTELFHAFVHQVTLLNQYNRKKSETGELITEKADVETAIEIMFESIILKIDELDGSLRQFYEDLKQYIQKRSNEHETYQFTQREIRQEFKISKTQLHRYFNDLLNLEYITQIGGYANRGFTYKVTYWDNITHLRDKIKKYLHEQLNKL